MIQQSLFIPLNSTVSPEAAPRLSRQHHAILERLRQGPVRNTELTEIALRYSARIGELRNAGYDIRKQAISEERGVFEYWLEGVGIDG